MNPPPFRRTRVLPLDTAWSATLPAPLGQDPARPHARTVHAPLQPHAQGRAQPRGPRAGQRQTKPGPFDALLDGLDIQELDSQTLFDRFFGPQGGNAPGDR